MSRILIIGKTKDFMISSVRHITSQNKTDDIYKDCILNDAIKECFSLGIDSLYAANINSDSDIINLIDCIIQNDFEYIVPLIDINSSFYHEGLDTHVLYSELLLDNISKYTNSTIIFTGSHAKLYESIDHFLDDTANSLTFFKEKTMYLLNMSYGKNMVFILNNSSDFNFANVVLASLLSIKNNDYPISNLLNNAVFDIDKWDIKNIDAAYFKNNITRKVTIDNLVNMHIENIIEKNILAMRTKKWIDSILDFSDFIGKINKTQYKFAIEKRASTILQRKKGLTINDYSINSVDFYEGIYRLDIDIVPKFFYGEPIKIIKEF